jgi:ribonucleoside-diphosphate reductase alpha chain
MAQSHFTADIARHIWDAKYRYRDADRVYDQTIEDTWRRIAQALASVEASKQAQWTDRFYAALEDFKFLPGGRIQAGAGTSRRVTLFNCFVMGIIEDSMDGIFDGLKQGALTMQQGGGVGYDFSTLRPRGFPARTTGTVASGPVSFMRIWDSMCATLLSTGARRGAMMATLRCDHPDIEEYISAKQDPRELRHFNLSVQVSDAFMEAVQHDMDWALAFPADELGDHLAEGESVQRRWTGKSAATPCRVLKRVRARDLWDKIMRATYDYAEPGVLFVDRINRLNNLWYREHITATNPCVTADTWVHTADGPRQVKELIGRSFAALVNGKAYPVSAKGFFSTGRKSIFRLTTREGYEVRLTRNHPVLKVTQRTRWRLQTVWTAAGDVRAGDQVVIHDHRGGNLWSGPYGENEGYLLGLLIGDGTFSENQAQLCAWPRAAAAHGSGASSGVEAIMKSVETITTAMPHRRDYRGWRLSWSGEFYYLRLASLTRLAAELGVYPGRKTITPEIERCSGSFYKGFLRGLFDADGSIQGTQRKGVSVRLAQSDEVLLTAVQRMLLRLGIASKLYINRRSAGARLLPDGRGGRRAFACRADHELTISGDNLVYFNETIGFTDGDKSARLRSALGAYKRSFNRERFLVTVTAIAKDGTENVYDVEVPGTNAFDANGFYVHNCGELPLPPYGACDLGAINLTRFVREPFTADAHLDLAGVRETAMIATRMMDNVIDLSQFPLPQQAEQARGVRRLGLGLTGLADALIMLGLNYADQEARTLAAGVMQTICHTAYQTSIALAAEKGSFPWLDRDKHLQGDFIHTLPEDIRAGIAHRGIRNSHLTTIAPTGTISLLANNVSSGIEPVYDFAYTRRVLEVDGRYVPYGLTDYAYALWQELRGNPLPPYFVDAGTLAPIAHLDMQAALQPYVDSAISKTINIPEHYPFDDFRSLYELAFDKGLKGCTTFRPNLITGAVLAPEETAQDTRAPHCCSIEREAD